MTPPLRRRYRQWIMPQMAEEERVLYVADKPYVSHRKKRKKKKRAKKV